MGSGEDVEEGPSASARRRVLLVDDSEQIRSILKSMLQASGFDVVEAENGAEGLRHLREDPAIGLVFLDMHMPRMDGLEVLRVIQAAPLLGKVPVVVMTGDSGQSGLDAKDLGAVGVLQKPFRGDAVVRIAQSLCLFDTRESV